MMFAKKESKNSNEREDTLNVFAILQEMVILTELGKTLPKVTIIGALYFIKRQSEPKGRSLLVSINLVQDSNQ